MAVTLAHDAAAFGSGELIRGETPAFFAMIVGGAGLIALALSLVFGGRGGVGPAVGLLLAGWAVTLVGAGPLMRVDFVLVGAGHLAVAEIAFWSIDRRSQPGPDRGAALATRAAELAALLALVVLCGWLLAGTVAAVAGGVSLDLAGAVAVLGFGVAVVVLVRRA
jgi:hypothetical protein